MRLPVPPLRHSLTNVSTLMNPKGFDGAYRARTYDPLLVRQVLSQLSYDPMLFICHVSFDTNDPEETRTLDLRRDRAAL